MDEDVHNAKVAMVSIDIVFIGSGFLLMLDDRHAAYAVIRKARSYRHHVAVKIREVHWVDQQTIHANCGSTQLGQFPHCNASCNWLAQMHELACNRWSSLRTDHSSHTELRLAKGRLMRSLCCSTKAITR